MIFGLYYRVTFDRHTVLHYAAEGGNKEICELLIPNMSTEAIDAACKGVTYPGYNTPFPLSI